MVFPYDARHMPAYALTYAGTSLAGFGALATLLSEDSYFGFFLSHTCGRFRLLHLDINRMGDERLFAGKVVQQKRRDLGIKYHMENDGGRRSRLTLRRIVGQHNLIIEYHEFRKFWNYLHTLMLLSYRFGRELEGFFAPMILLNFTISSFLICATLFQIAVVSSCIPRHLNFRWLCLFDFIERRYVGTPCLSWSAILIVENGIHVTHWISK